MARCTFHGWKLMNKLPLATNMHLCCRDANHKHLYLLVSAALKLGFWQRGKGRTGRGREKEDNGGKRQGETVLSFILGNERVVVSIVPNCVEFICLKALSWMKGRWSASYICCIQTGWPSCCEDCFPKLSGEENITFSLKYYLMSFIILNSFPLGSAMSPYQ